MRSKKGKSRREGGDETVRVAGVDGGMVGGRGRMEGWKEGGA